METNGLSMLINQFYQLITKDPPADPSQLWDLYCRCDLGITPKPFGAGLSGSEQVLRSVREGRITVGYNTLSETVANLRLRTIGYQQESGILLRTKGPITPDSHAIKAVQSMVDVAYNPTRMVVQTPRHFDRKNI